MSKEGQGIHLKGLDLTIYRQAKAGAALEGITMGQWVGKAIEEKVERDKERKMSETAKKGAAFRRMITEGETRR